MMSGKSGKRFGHRHKHRTYQERMVGDERAYGASITSLTGVSWEPPQQPPKFIPGGNTPNAPKPNPRGTGRFLVSDVLSQTFTVIFANIVPFGLLAILMMSPTYIFLILVYFADYQYFSSLVDSGFGGWFSISGIIEFLLSSLLAAALVYGTFQEIRKQNISLQDCIFRGLEQIVPVIGVAFVTAIMVGVGLMFFMIPGFIILTIVWVAIPAAVVEKSGVGDSVQRSFDLTSGFRWKVAEIAAFAVVLEYAIDFVAELFFSAFQSLVIYLLIYVLLSAAAAVFSGVLTAVSYSQLRLAKEGTGVDEIAAVSD
jgi:hypothetical protein